MKKLFLIFLILTTLLFISSCDTKETENNESSSSNETSSIEETSTEEQNENFIIGFAISNEQLNVIDLTKEEIKVLYEKGEMHFFKKHIIFNNGKSKNIVLQLDETGTVTKAKSYKEKPLDEKGYLNTNFLDGESFQNIFEVVECYGEPAAFYEESLVFYGRNNEGNHYGLEIYFYENGNVKESWVYGPDL